MASVPHQRNNIHRRTLLTGLIAGLLTSSVAASAAELPADASPEWFKGNVHAHSVWSDGDAFPEMVADWYKSHGYQFLGLSDHNILLRGEYSTLVQRKPKPIPLVAVETYRKRFGDDWVQTQGEGASLAIRLRTLDECRAKLEEPGKFLLIENEEITGGWKNHAIHVNALNVAEVIQPQPGDSVAETLQAAAAAVAAQSKRTGRPMLAIANHPNWAWYDVAPEDLAHAAGLRFVEVCNMYPHGNNPGDAARAGSERVWDVANTIRLGKLRQPPLYGLAADDTHDYHEFGPEKANPGRGWIVVRAQELSAAAIVEAMGRGDFYFSTGVTLSAVTYNRQAKTLTVAVKPEPGTRYTIEFHGTLTGVDPTGWPVYVPTPPGKPARSVRKYSPDIGKVFSAVEATEATYKLNGHELYVRAVVRADKPLANPVAAEDRKQEAWTQPAGWESQVAERPKN
jgi:hypothetical protein